jgi:hypothetical protein
VAFTRLDHNAINYTKTLTWVEEAKVPRRNRTRGSTLADYLGRPRSQASTFSNEHYQDTNTSQECYCHLE